MRVMVGAQTILALALCACSGVDASKYDHVKGPAFGDDESGDDFRPVSSVIERRCGTLDCHGSEARPLRIYSQFGLRKHIDKNPDAGQYFPGGLDATTPDELLDNYRSMIGLEPEKLDLVVAKKAKVETLTLVRKPRLAEKHKGGLVWNKGDDGDVCLVNWLTGVADTSTCTAELMHP